LRWIKKLKIMRIKFSWIVLLGLMASCTVSKRIDKWGYRFTFNKAHHVNVAEKEPTNSEKTVALPSEAKEPVSYVTLSDLKEKPEISHLEQNHSVLTKASNSNTSSTIFAKSENPKMAKSRIEMENKKPSISDARANKIVAKQKKLISAHVGNSSRPEMAVLILLAIFIPPLAVYMYEGSWTERCTLNLILTILCGIPGIIHALIVVLD